MSLLSSYKKITTKTKKRSKKAMDNYKKCNENLKRVIVQINDDCKKAKEEHQNLLDEFKLSKTILESEYKASLNDICLMESETPLPPVIDIKQNLAVDNIHHSYD